MNGIMTVNKNPKFEFIDLFAGIGGMRLGFQNAGGKCVFSSEWDPHAVKTYVANFDEVPFGDITQLDINDLPEFDILSAGFPCQPFSSFGKREGFKHKTQGTLFHDVLTIIKARKPKAFLLENVKGLLSHDNKETMKTIMRSLRRAGYFVDYAVLNSADYGVPQKRERVYIVGFRKVDFDEFPMSFPEPKKRKVGIGKFIESDVTGYSISKHLQKVYIYKKDDGRPERVNPKTKTQVKTLVASYHKIQRMTGTFVEDGPTGLRLLTANECKMIMGFPIDFKIPVSRTQMYRQMGNSVAVPVVAAVAQEIVKTLRENDLLKSSTRGKI
jgi:DNA (cytosine-5)-methyltransferase 1